MTNEPESTCHQKWANGEHNSIQNYARNTAISLSRLTCMTLVLAKTSGRETMHSVSSCAMAQQSYCPQDLNIVRRRGSPELCLKYVVILDNLEPRPFFHKPFSDGFCLLSVEDNFLFDEIVHNLIF